MKELKNALKTNNKSLEKLQRLVEKRLEKRGSMTDTMNGLIDDAVEASEDSRADIIEDIASEANRAKSTIHNILNGQINCPPKDPVLDGFGTALAKRLSGSASSITDKIINAAERDGCDYSEDGD